MISVYLFSLSFLALLLAPMGFVGVYRADFSYLLALVLLICLPILSSLRNSQPSIRISYVAPPLFFLSLSFLASGTVATDVRAHTTYYLALIVQMFFVLNFSGKIYIPKRKLLVILKFVFYITVLTALIHLLVGSGRRGWNWPVSISIQELFLIHVFFAVVMLQGWRKTVPMLLAIVPLLIFRSSGKAALFVLLFAYLLWPLAKLRFVNFCIKNVAVIYAITSAIAVIVLAFFYKNDIYELYYYSKSILIEDKIDFYRRLSLLIEGIYVATDLKRLLLGAGFGYENYISVVDSYLENTPQLLPLTLIGYGGILLLGAFFVFIKKYRDLCVAVLPSKEGMVIINLHVVCFLAFLTTHEYINNPFFFLGLFIFLLAARSAKGKDVFQKVGMGEGRRAVI